MSVSASVDLSTDWGPARDQGQRPTCLAFALSDINRDANQAGLLSPEYLYRSTARQTNAWKAGDGLMLTPAVKAVAAPGQPEEPHCVYTNDEPAECPPLLPAFSASNAANSVDLYKCAVEAGPMTTTEIVAHLLTGRPVGLVVKLTETFYKPSAGIIGFVSKVFPDRRHAVVAVGMGIHKNTTEPHLRIRNSWGGDWGEGGSAWLPFKYVDVHAVTAFKV